MDQHPLIDRQETPHANGLQACRFVNFLHQILKFPLSTGFFYSLSPLDQ